MGNSIKNQLINIGGTMIVKNSEDTVGEALKSLLPVCSQIVVVDTGSLDSTPAICSKLGAEVHFFEWTGNFSEARNYALQFMRTEWIISIDSDELLDINSFMNNISLFSKTNIGGIRVKIFNFLHNSNDNYSDKQTATEHKYTRILRRKLINPINGNSGNPYYQGKIHEQVAPSIIESGLEIIDSDIIINHYGYSSLSDEKITRNRNLLEEEINSNPDDDWLKYHLAETEFAAGNTEKAQKLFADIINSIKLTQSQKEMSKLRLAQIALKNNNYSDVVNLLDFISADINREGFRKYIISTALLMDGNYSRCLEYINSFEVRESTMVEREQAEKISNVATKLMSGQFSIF